MSHYDRPLYKLGALPSYMPVLPLPPGRESMPAKVNDYRDVPEEPKFDPKIHLDLGRPQFVR